MSPCLRSPRWGLAVSCAAVLAAFVDPGRAAAQIIVTDVIGHMPQTEFASVIANQNYKDWGNEPFIAVNPVNPNQIVVSGFGYSTPTGSLWYSTDGGNSYGMRFPITAPPSASNGPNDQVYAYDSTGTLHSVQLTSTSSTNQFVFHGSTTDPSRDGQFGRPASLWSWTSSNIAASTGTTPDQPWMAVRGGGPTAKIFAAYDNFDSTFTTVEQRVAVSNDGGATFSTPVAVSAGGRISTTTNPGLRITADATGNKVYAVFGIGTTSVGGVQNVNYRLNESIDGGVTWRYTGSTANPGGLAVDSGSSAQIGSFFGGKNQLRGNTTAVAVDATGSHVYVVYGKRNGANVDQLWLAEFHPTNPLDVTSNLVLRGSTLLSSAIDPAALPSVTVTASGIVAVMYDTFSGGRYHTHFATSVDFGLNFLDQDIYNFDPSFIVLGSSAFPSSNRALGDYDYITSLGDTVYGVFAAQGNVNSGGINTTNMITPFTFSATLVPVPEPMSVALAGAGALVGFAWWRRRKSPDRGR